jgi:hypothetical protein
MQTSKTHNKKYMNSHLNLDAPHKWDSEKTHLCRNEFSIFNQGLVIYVKINTWIVKICTSTNGQVSSRISAFLIEVGTEEINEKECIINVGRCFFG